MDPSPGEVTRLLDEIGRGDHGAVDRLLPHVYEDLRQLARRVHRGPNARHSLRPTDLVHEAYGRLVGGATGWSDRQHFLAVAAMAMRQVLADYARRMRADKRGGQRSRVDLTESLLAGAGADAVDLMALDDALSELAAIDPRQARIVELRFLAGLSVAETAAVVGVAERTVKLDWQLARARLLRSLLAGGE